MKYPFKIETNTGLYRRYRLARHTPRFLQRPLTWLTGIALPGQEPLFKPSRMLYAISGIAFFWLTVAGFFLLAWLVSIGLPYMALAPLHFLLALVLAGLMRALGSVHLHHASHGHLGAHDKLIGEIASLSGMALPFETYKREHIGGHHPGLGTDLDGDREYIKELGFTSKQRSFRGYWMLYLWHLMSPMTRLRYWTGRIKANWEKQPGWRQALFLLGLAGPMILAISLTLMLGAMWPLLGWLMYAGAQFLMTPIFHATYALIKHEWWLERGAGQSKIDWYRSQTFAHLLLPKLPDGSMHGMMWLGAWGWFWLKFAGNILIRISVFGITSDLMAHNIHHNNTFPPQYDYRHWPYEQREVMLHPQWKGFSVFDHSLIETLNRLFRRLADA